MPHDGYDQHLRRIWREYACTVQLMSDVVMRYFPEGTRLKRPSGGFILRVQLPENIDSLERLGEMIKSLSV